MLKPFVQVGNQQMTLELEWSGQEAFRAQPLKDWSVNGQPAGKTRSSGPFTFATIHEAGHMVSSKLTDHDCELF